ncbi:hypothetical protein MMC34_002900 [Xylographa carneopallida]|nr:hypothetical protein [Xylographa carneopallida]
MPPLGNSWQQGRDKPLPPMLPVLKGTGFNYASNHNSTGFGTDETGMSETSTGPRRVDDSLGDVGLYSSSLLTTLFAASARSPSILKSQPATPTTAVFATFQFKAPTKPHANDPSPDISPRTTTNTTGPALAVAAAPITFSKFYSSAVARPFSGRTHYSGAPLHE